MRLHGLLGLAVCLCPSLLPSSVLAAGEHQTFPYDAVIEAPSAYVRSGGGEEYYPTTRLTRGAKVRVFRHDSGGWYMIAPPTGSFSWVAAQFVRLTGPNTGEVVEDNIVAYVGTDFGDDHSVWQRRLSPGESFKIIGEKVMTTDRGSERMLKIQPPRREWRWIAGQDVVSQNNRIQPPLAQKPRPHTAQTNRPPTSRPTRAPSNPGTPQLLDQPNWNDPNLKIAGGRTTTRRPARDGNEILARLAEDRRRLDTLDANFRTVAMADKSRWNFSQIEAGYVALQNETSNDSLKRDIRMRFAALQRYQKAKAIYDDITRLTSETDRRDAELLSLQSGGVTPAHMTSNQPSGQTLQMSGVMDSAYMDAGAQLPQGPPVTQATAVKPVAPNATGLIGAGIIEHSIVPGTPKFVLLTPTGKILAYLESDSVDLTGHIGKPMGLAGKRHYRKDLQTDYIKIEAVKEVQLRK